MNKTRGEIRDGFLAWLKQNQPKDAERLLNAAEFGVSVLLLGKREIQEDEDLYSVTDLERVERWCDLMRTDDAWQRMDGSRILAQTLNAYRRYVEWLDLEQEREDKSALGAASAYSEENPEIPIAADAQNDYPDYSIDLTDEELIEEGAATEVVMTRYERNPRARQRCIEAYGSTYRCEVCGFNFEEVYGPRDAGQYIEVHHVAEHAVRSKLQGRHTVDCKRDLIPLCANCHRMIHHLRPQTLSPDELRAIMAKQHQK